MKSTYARMQSTLTFSDLELLLALVRGRTLHGAAERMKVDASTVFRSIKRMEKDMGELLFERSRQGYMPTELAQELAIHAERIESQLNEAREAASRSDGEPSGVVRITTTDTVLHSVLLPVMQRFSDRYPKIELELIAGNTLANLSRRDADVAVRATRAPPEHLVGSRLGTLRAAVFASREYLARRNGATVLEDLDWIVLDDTLPDHPSQKWRRQRLPKARVRHKVNSVLSVAGAVVHGMGAGVVPMVVLQDHPEVMIVDGPLEELDTDLWVLAHPDVRHLQRVKVLFDYLKDNIRLESNRDKSRNSG
jgi:DNA-binding transcriptional LysR family regulator